MGSKSATIIVFVAIALIAIGLASVCASITGEYHLNLTDDNSTHVNNTTDIIHHEDTQSSSQQEVPYTPPKPDEPEENTTA